MGCKLWRNVGSWLELFKVTYDENDQINDR